MNIPVVFLDGLDVLAEFWLLKLKLLFELILLSKLEL